MYALTNEYVTHFSQNVPKSKSSNFHWTKKKKKNLLTQFPALHTLEKPHALSESSRDSQGPLKATSGSDFLFLLNSLTSLLPHSSHLTLYIEPSMKPPLLSAKHHQSKAVVEIATEGFWIIERNYYCQPQK